MEDPKADKGFLEKPSQLTPTCSKSTIEILEKGVKYVKINDKNTRTTSDGLVHFLVSI